MQLNPQERINIKRLRTDAAATRVVTLFGLLVLGMFLLIIMHMLSNATPLLSTPRLAFLKSMELNSSSPMLAVQQMGDEVIGISQHNCKIVLQTVNPDVVNTATEFHHPCSSQFIPVSNENGYDSNYAILRENGLLEIFSVSDLTTDVQRTLVGSFAISDFSAISAKYDLASAKWKIDKYGQQIVLHALLDGQQAIMVWHQLNQLEPAQFMIVEQVERLTPLPRFDQAIVVFKGQSTLISKEAEVLQTLSSDTADDAEVLSSPNQQTIFIPTANAGMQVWRSANIGGQFLFSQSEQLLSATRTAWQRVVFDRHTLVAVASDAQDNLLIFNSATNEIVRQQLTRRPIQFLHWHNQRLYVFSGNKVHIYELEDAVGITTWKSLFAEVQYAGYASQQYIWQTSQSAEYVEPKFSLIPLIIGSLKASVLALFVAVPLALGAAIYTAYFASLTLRSYVKPSIEMIEAIPSVVIGFIAAVWLAPFAERSLVSLLGTIICLPAIVLLMAAMHGYLKETHVYDGKQRFYLLAASLLFLSLLAGVFLFLSWSQIVMFSDESNTALTHLGDYAISKTTVVVALALGVAVAPTIYSLVDDALFEVPDGVKHASFALGATELQTLVKVVLVVALPSIISAIMLGLGRAFGETMIVLMVTGNTPIADWDLLSGLRSLTSNLTIELQESSVDSAHYHILFLTAVILFAFTFMINTIASLLKRRLQSKNEHV